MTLVEQLRSQPEKRIPAALVAAFLLQTAGALFWAGSAAERIADLERSRAYDQSAIAKVAAGDNCVALSDASGNWRILSYTPAGLLSAAAGPVSIPGGSTGSPIVSLSLTAGRWRLSGMVQFFGANTTNSFTRAEISASSSSFTGTRGLNQIYFANDTTAQVGAGSISPFDITLTATTTYYLIAAHRSASDNCFGSLRAERIA